LADAGTAESKTERRGRSSTEYWRTAVERVSGGYGGSAHLPHSTTSTISTISTIHAPTSAPDAVTNSTTSTISTALGGEPAIVDPDDYEVMERAAMMAQDGAIPWGLAQRLATFDAREAVDMVEPVDPD